MKRRQLLTATALVAVTTWVFAQTPDADALILSAQNISKVSGSEAEIEIENTDSAGRMKTRKIYAASKLKSAQMDVMRVARFTQPADFVGTATLIHENLDRDDDIWLYLPSVKRVKRILASGRKDRFLGTEFSYGDVIGFKASEWVNQITGSKSIGADACWLVTSTSRNRDVAESYGYSKRVTAVRKSDYFPLEIELWNLDGNRAKTVTAEEISSVGEGKLQAMKITAVNLIDQQKTIFRFKSFKLSPNLARDIFKSERLGDS